MSQELADFLSAHADEVINARRRLMEGAVDSELLGSLAPSRRHFPRSVTLFLMSSATLAVELVVLHSCFGWSGLAI